MSDSIYDGMISIYGVHDIYSEKFAKKLLGESEIEDVLRRLDRLTLDEARMTGTETLQVVHGLVTNMKLVMDGTWPFLHSFSMTHLPFPRVDGRTSMYDIRQALGMLNLRPVAEGLTAAVSYDAKPHGRYKQDQT